MAKQSLGRGFDLLIPKDFDNQILEDDINRVQKVLISDILPNKTQPRRNFDQTAHKELAESVKRHGVLQPIIVVRSGQNYQIVAGERRWRAAKEANLSHIPAIVRSLKELEQLEIALIENVQRSDLSPLEEALAIYRLQQQFGLALEEIAKKLGKAVSTVSNTTRLLNLPDKAKQLLAEGKISEGHARALLALNYDPKLQEQLLNSITKNNWTVRQAEEFVLNLKKSSGKTTVNKEESAVAEKLSKKLKLQVDIKPMAKGGRLVITYKNQAELNKISKNLG